MSKILVFAGVTKQQLSDFIQSKQEKRKLQDYPTIKRIPTSYSCIDAIERYSTAPCWYCTLNFKKRLIQILVITSNSPEIIALGNFCTFVCCVNYTRVYYPHKFEDAIKSTMQVLTGNTAMIHTMLIAPHSELIKFGQGTLTDEQYQNYIFSLERSYGLFIE